jgi:branched-chain amino acid transport system substrate-binding protein
MAPRSVCCALLTALAFAACKEEANRPAGDAEAGAAPAGADAKPGGKKLRIGIINSITGPEAPIGEALSNGYKLAVEDLKRADIPVEIVSEDDTGKPQTAMSAFEKLATRDEVIGVVGPYTSASANAVVRLAERYKVPLLVPAAAKEEITRQGLAYVFRLNAPADVYASSVLDAVLSVGQPKTIALVYENTDFGTSTAKNAREVATKRGLTILADEAYSKGSPDYRSTLGRVKAANPDLIFMVSYVADAILLMRQARELGLKPKAFLGGGAGFTSNQFLAEHAISEGVFSATQWTEDVSWPGAKEWATRYRMTFGGKEPPYHAACAYEALRIMATAAKNAGGDPSKLRELLRKDTWVGIMGEVKFADFSGFTNQNQHTMLVVQVQNGKYATVAPPEFASAKPVYPFPGFK